MALQFTISTSNKNEPWSVANRTIPCALPPWLSTAFSVGAYFCLGPQPAIFLALGLVILTFIGALLSLSFTVQVAMSWALAAAVTALHIMRRGRAFDQGYRTMGRPPSRSQAATTDERASPAVAATAVGVEEPAGPTDSPQPAGASATVATPVASLAAAAGELRKRLGAKLGPNTHVAEEPWPSSQAGGASQASDLAGPGAHPPRPPGAVPLTRQVLESGLAAAGFYDIRRTSTARTAAWAATVTEPAAVAAAAAAPGAATAAAAAGATAPAVYAGLQASWAHTAHPASAARTGPAATEVPPGWFGGYPGEAAGDRGEEGGGEGGTSLQGIWAGLPLTAFCEVLRLVGDAERRSIRLVCTEWLSGAGACTTHLKLPRGALRHLPSLAAAFPLVTTLDLSAALHHISPSRVRQLAAMRHLVALTLGCPAAGSGPGSGTGFRGGPGSRMYSAAACVGGAAAAVTDGCVRELVNLTRGPAAAAASADHGLGSGYYAGLGFGFSQLAAGPAPWAWPGAAVPSGLSCGAAGGPASTSSGSSRPTGRCSAGPGLRELSLAHCVHVSDAGLMSLAHLTTLASLDLTGCVSVTDVGIMVLARLTALSSLELSWCLKVSNAGLRALAVLPRLIHLGISGCPLVSEAGVLGLTAISSLHSLDLTHLGLGPARPAITDATLAALAAHLDLTHLALGGGGATPAAVAPRISDAGLLAIAESCRHLAAITLLALPDVTDAGLAALAGSLAGLTALVVRGCGAGVTRGCVAAVAEAVTRQPRGNLSSGGSSSSGGGGGGGGGGGLQELSLLYNPSLDLRDEDVARLCALPPQAPMTRRPSATHREGREGRGAPAPHSREGRSGLSFLGLGGFSGLMAPSPALAPAPPGQGPVPGAGSTAPGFETASGMGPASLRALARLTWLTSLSLVGYQGTFWSPQEQVGGNFSDYTISLRTLASRSSFESGGGGGGGGVSSSGGRGGSSSGGGRVESNIAVGSGSLCVPVVMRGSAAAGSSAGGVAASAAWAASASAVVPLTSLQRLSYLDLSGGSHLDDAALAAVAHAAVGLRTLLLPRCSRVSDAGLEAMAARLTDLRVLNLSNCSRVTDAGLSSLAHHSPLSQLVLKNCPAVTDAGVAALAALNRLESLDLSHANARLSGVGFAAFARHRSATRLAALMLSHCPGLDDRGLGQLCGALRGLARLDLSGCSGLTDAGGTCLGRLSLLTDVDLSYCPRVGDPTLEALAPLRLLTAVKMPGCVRVSDIGLAALAAAPGGGGGGAIRHPSNIAPAATAAAATTTEGFAATTMATNVSNPAGGGGRGGGGSGARANAGVGGGTGGSPLLHLHLDSCISITDAGLSQLAALSSLTSLRLTRCVAVTDGGVAALAALTRLCALSLAHCPAVTQSGLLALSGITSLASLEF